MGRTKDNYLDLCDSRFTYEPATGYIRSKKNGKVLGSKSNYGHLLLSIYLEGECVRVSAHRVAWYLYYNEIPPKNIIHRNDNILDNRIDNLAAADDSQIVQYRKKVKHKTSKYLGVSWCDRNAKWIAAYGLNRKGYHIGYYNDEVEAAKAYDVKIKEVFGENARVNFPAKKKEKKK